MSTISNSNISITVLEDAVQVCAGIHSATLATPEPEALAQRLREHLLTATDSPNSLLSPAEVARRLGVSRDVVYDLIRSGDLTTIRVGAGRRQLHRIEPSAVERFIDENRSAA